MSAGAEHVEELILGNPTFSQVTNEIASPMERRPGPAWWGAFLTAVSVLTLGVVLIGYTMATGIGVWGLNRTVGWGYDITNFVFWVGIGHAGTLISAILLLFRQRWRTGERWQAVSVTAPPMPSPLRNSRRLAGGRGGSSRSSLSGDGTSESGPRGSIHGVGCFLRRLIGTPSLSLDPGENRTRLSPLVVYAAHPPSQ